MMDLPTSAAEELTAGPQLQATSQDVVVAPTPALVVSSPNPQEIQEPSQRGLTETQPKDHEQVSGTPVSAPSATSTPVQGPNSAPAPVITTPGNQSRSSEPPRPTPSSTTPVPRPASTQNVPNTQPIHTARQRPTPAPVNQQQQQQQFVPTPRPVADVTSASSNPAPASWNAPPPQSVPMQHQHAQQQQQQQQQQQFMQIQPRSVQGLSDPRVTAALYDTLASLDPYKGTPVDLIHILVKAATRDCEVANDIKNLHARRMADPQYLAILKAASQQPSQPQQRPPPQVHYSQTPQQGYQQQHYPPQPPPPQPEPQYIRHYIPGRGPPPPPEPPPPPQQYPTTSQYYRTVDPNVTPTQQQDPDIPYDEPHAPKEKPINITWILDRAEADMGWTGKHDNVKTDGRKQARAEQTAVLVGKLVKKCEAFMESRVTFPNRVHVLTVMREIIMCVLETTDPIISEELRKKWPEYDNMFFSAVGKMTPGQRSKLKVLEGGKWLQEFQETVDLANDQGIFVRLKDALAMIDCSH